MKRVYRYFWLLGAIGLVVFCDPAAGAPLRADAVAQKTDVFTGEPFIVQVRVSGVDQPERPEVPDVPEFSVVFQGGRQNSSSSISIVNGKMTRNVHRETVFSYQFTPRQAGRAAIPAIAVHGDGQTAMTQPIPITVRPPQASDADSFKLRIQVSKTRCYVGEPVVFTLTWYLGEDVRNFQLTLPLLEEQDAFSFIDPQKPLDPNKQYYRISLGGDEVVAEKGRGRLDGTSYATLSFQKVLIPKKAGNLSIAPATIVCEALAGYEKRRSPFDDDFFSDFFHDDFFGMGRKGVYRRVVVPSNGTELHVSELPAAGKPANFSGNVGVYRIHGTATPTEVQVGDPITLQVALSGPEYPAQAVLPPLTEQPRLVRDFKIPGTRAAGEISGRSKVFTQTIRPLRPDVKEIPPIELSYFDTREKAYKVVRTEPIPIGVREAKIVTARDAEGLPGPAGGTGSEVETWSKGIAYNYEDEGVLRNRLHDPVAWLLSPAGAGVVFLPPAIYGLLLGGTAFVRRRKADPLALRAKKAGAALAAALKKAGKASGDGERIDILLDAFRQYLGDKLRLPAGALTFRDVKELLQERGVTPEILERLKTFLESCEAGRYAGNPQALDAPSMLPAARTLMKELNRYL